MEKNTLSYNGEPDLHRSKLIEKLNPKGLLAICDIGKPVIGETIEEKSDQIIAFSRPLKFDKDDERHTGSTIKFINDFFDVNSYHDTRYADTNGLSCKRGKFRSLIDIFLITRFYFPKVKLETVVRHIYKPQRKGLHVQVCNTIQRRVYDGRAKRVSLGSECKDELGFSQQKYHEIV